MNKRRNTIRNILFAVGVISVVIMLLTLDISWDVLWESLARAGYWLIVIVALWCFLYTMNTFAWWIILRESGPMTISFGRLLKTTLSGFALNSATPVGLLGGEPYKIMELTPYVGTQRATSSVLLFTMMHIFSHFWYWVTAIVLFIAFLPVDAGMGVLLTVSSLFCAGGIYLFLRGYKRGLVVGAIRWIGHLPGLRGWSQRFTAAHAEDLQKIDSQIAALHAQSRRSFYASLALEYVGRMMQSLEIMFMLLLFGAECSWMTYVQSVLILAFTSLFANLLGFIPMQLGGREGGFALSTAQLGLTGGMGMFISIICRVRELFFTCIGLALMKVKNGQSSPLRFAVLAAGEGSRLAEEGITVPKPLVQLGGTPLLDRLLRLFAEYEPKEILVITNERVNEQLQTLPQAVPYKLIVKNTPSSMHSFYELMPLLGQGPFILTTVDTVFRPEEFRTYVQTFLRALQNDKECAGVMGVTSFVDDEKPLWVSTDSALKITGFHDSQEQFQTSGAAGECRFVSGGIYGLTDRCFPTLRRCIESGQSRMRNFQRAMVADGLKLSAFPFSKVLDIDHASDITKAEEFLTHPGEFAKTP